MATTSYSPNNLTYAQQLTLAQAQLSAITAQSALQQANLNAQIAWLQAQVAAGTTSGS